MTNSIEKTREEKQEIVEEKILSLLPIGTIVRLVEGTKRVMIFGIRQTVENHPELEFDYIGVPYPEGNLGDDYQYVFNGEEIEEVYYLGFEDIERQQFIDELAKQYAEKLSL